MALTVYAENMGFFHKGSGGKGIAPGDVCMTPPPPPAGPIPVPYVNIAQASDLTKGSKTVKIDGEPTALEDVSEVSTSSGNEPGSQPPKGVVTATNKGKASFTMWSFTVKVEGKGVCRHGDPMFQNELCTPPNIVCVSADVAIQAQSFGYSTDTYKCTKCEEEAFKRYAPTTAQKEKANKDGGKTGCWSCKVKTNRFERKGKMVTSKKWTADHQPPQAYVWNHMGGCKGACGTKAEKKACNEKFKKWATDIDTCLPHCRTCSNSQGGYISNYWGENFISDLLALLS